MRRAALALALAALAATAGRAAGQTDAASSDLTAPPGAATTYSTPADRQVTVTARDSGSSATGEAGLLVVASMFTASPACEAGAATPDCAVGCAPLQSPNTPSASCTSSTPPAAGDADAQWTVADVTDNGDGTYLVQYHAEVPGSYDLTVGIATPGGLAASYYDNVWFSGAASLEQVDATVDFDWGSGALTTYGVDYVAVRWEGKLLADNTETHVLYATADDGVRVWLDRQLVIDQWEDAAGVEAWAAVDLTAGHLHDIIVEYQELTGDASVRLQWSAPSVFKQVVPAANLHSVEQVSGSPFSVTVTPDLTMEPTTTTAAGDALVAAEAGTQGSFTVTARDVFGNVHDAVSGSTLAATWAPGPAPAGSTTYLGAGEYQVDYTFTASGAQTLDVTADGTSISGATWAAVVSPAAADETTTQAGGAGASAATAGVTASFTVQLRDANANNLDTGDDTVEVTLDDGGSNVVVPVVAYSGAGGVYNALYTATAPATYTLTVVVNGADSGLSPAVTVSPGATHPEASTMTGAGLSAATAGSAASVVLQARDEFGNARAAGGDTVAVALDGAGATGVTDNTDGTYALTWTPTASGDYEVTVTVDGRDADGSPFVVTVSPGALDESQSTASADVTDAQRAGTEATFVVTARDANGNALEAGGDAVAATLTCSTGNAAAVTDNSDGTYAVAYTPDETGAPCSLAVTIGGTGILGSPFSVTVTAGEPDPASCTLGGAGLNAGVVGTASAVTISAVDADGNALAAGGSTFEVEVTRDSDGSAVSPAVTDNADGTYAVAYTPLAQGAHTTAAYAVLPGGLASSYWTNDAWEGAAAVTGSDATLDFEWLYAEPAGGVPADYWSARWEGRLEVPETATWTLYAEVSGLSGVRVTVNGEAVIDALEPQAGTTEPYGSVALAAGGPTHDLVVDFVEQTGLARLTLSWQSAGTAKEVVPATALHARTLVASTEATAVAAGANAAAASTVHTSAVASPSEDLLALASDVATAAQAGVAFAMTVQGRDAYGALQTEAGREGAYTVDLNEVDGAGTVSGTVSDAAMGAYPVTGLAATFVGLASLEVKLGGDHVAGSPFSVTVAPGAVDTASCTAESLDLAPDAGVEQTFTIQARDANGNARAEGGDSFTVSADEDAGAGLVAGAVTDNGDGTYTVTLTLDAHDGWTLSIQDGALTHIDSSPFSLTVATGAAAAATTALTTALPAGTDGVASTFTVQATDAYGNDHGAGGEELVVEVSNRRGSLVRGAVTDNADGTYTGTYTVTPAGTYTLNVLLATPAAADAVLNGLTARYYNNRWLTGTPELTRTDPSLALDWGTGLVTPSAADYVSVQWTGYIKPANAAATAFSLACTAGGARLFVNGVLVFDDWDSSAGPYTGSYTFPTADLLYSIRVDFRHDTGSADAELSWDNSGGSTVVASAELFPQAEHISGSPFTLTVA